MSTTQRYHEATKYDPDSMQEHPGIEWSKQPIPWKEFHSTERIDLTDDLLVHRDPDTDEPVLVTPMDADLHLPHLSTLLLHANGVTAVLAQDDKKFLFRAAPSAGALYPTEIYVANLSIDGLEPGIYNYQVRDHSLAPLMEGEFRGDLQHAALGHPAIANARAVLLLSGVFERSSWRYHDRAYRRILLDTGHVLGNLTFFASELGLAAVPIGGFEDDSLASLFLLDDETEAMLALVALLPADEVESIASDHPSVVSEEAEGPILQAMHRSGNIAPNGSPTEPPALSSPRMPRDDSPVIQLIPEPVDWDNRRSSTILSRRSTRQFTGSPMMKEELAAVLADAHREYVQGKTHRFIAPARIETHVACLKVSGVEPGLYHYDPVSSDLHGTRMGRFEQRMGFVCLGQTLASEASAVVMHAVDLAALVADYGDRGYRYIGLDAGQLGHQMNLAALRLGLGASGIGGYFDDATAELLRLPSRYGIVYITVLGQPVLTE